MVKGDILASLSTDTHDGRGVSIGQENIAQLRFDRKLLAQQLDVLQAGRQQSRQWDKVAEENVRENAINLDRESELLEIQSQLSSHALQAVSRLLDARSSSKREYDQYYQAHLEHLLRNESLRQRMLQNDHSLQSLENAEQLAELDFKQSTLRIQRELQRIDSKIDSLSNQSMFTVGSSGARGSRGTGTGNREAGVAPTATFLYQPNTARTTSHCLCACLGSGEVRVRSVVAASLRCLRTIGSMVASRPR